MSNNSKEIFHSSFAVVIDPEFEKGEWTGNVSASIEEDLQGDLSEDEAEKILKVCAMIASTLHLMEEEPEFLDFLTNYFNKHFSKKLEKIYEVELEEPKKESPVFTRSSDGKVITLNFNTKTFGSA
tara:strand:+ start:359 stop:736 length:378 start_codon:yes stop_codon:yes gene_type:complete